MSKTFVEAKAENPRMRRRQPVGIIHGGGHQTIIHCCLCGATHTYATDWPEPRHSLRFRAHHNSGKCQEDEQ